MIEYGLNHTIRAKKKEVISILYSFTSYDMKFQTILIPKAISANSYHKKTGHFEPFLS